MKSLFGVALALLLFGCSHTYSVGLEEGEELSEAVAVRASREALEKSGLDISQLEPAPYGNSMSVFARNRLNPNHGYVLWRRYGEKKGYSYSVSIERVGRELICEVSKTK